MGKRTLASRARNLRKKIATNNMAFWLTTFSSIKMILISARDAAASETERRMRRSRQCCLGSTKETLRWDGGLS